MAYPNILFGPNGRQFIRDTARKHPLGTQLALQDGRRFRYGSFAATAVAAGRLCQSEVPNTSADELVVSAANAVGDRTVSITGVSLALVSADNYYAGGYLNVEDDTGEGHLYAIESSTSINASSVFTVTLAAGESIQVATVAATTVGVTRHPFNGIIIHPSPPTARVLGWTATCQPASGFGFLATAGPLSGLTDGTIVLYNPVQPSLSVDGAVQALVTATFVPGQFTVVAHVMEVAVDTEHSLLNALIDA